MMNAQKIGMIALTGLMLAGCASTMKLNTSSRVPAAQGEVKVKRTTNDNIRIELNVKHLADPRNLDPSRTIFVVWIAPAKHEDLVQNVGALKVDENLNGSLETTVAFKSFRLFITAESSPTVSNPSGEALLWTEVNAG